MKLYKSPTNQIYAYEFDGSQDHLIPNDYVVVTKEEADYIIVINIIVTTESQRQKRNNLLQESDWSQLSDTPVTNKEAWAIYRQTLRDITSQSGFPVNVIRPSKP